MTVKFLGGPAEGQILQLRRAPVFLRVTQSGDQWDALDQIEDTPRKSETVFVYVLANTPSRYHIRCSRRSGSGFFFAAEYRWIGADQPDGICLRNNQLWQLWCQDQAESTT